MIYYDNFETWGDSFEAVIAGIVGKETCSRLASSSFDYIEDAGDFVASHTDIHTISTAIHDWLCAQTFCVFHGTRLLPEEIDSVRRLGLVPLVATDRETRLTHILQSHKEWPTVQESLNEVIDDLGQKARQGRREGQVHFSLSRSGLMESFNHYLSHGSEFDQHVVRLLFGDMSGLELLRTETVPALVHAQMNGDELVQGAHPFFSYLDVMDSDEIPGLARTFLNAWAYKTTKPSFDIAKLRTDCCMMQQTGMPPDRILSIEMIDEVTAL